MRSSRLTISPFSTRKDGRLPSVVPVQTSSPVSLYASIETRRSPLRGLPLSSVSIAENAVIAMNIDRKSVDIRPISLLFY